jgi:hypothetical protein
LLLLPLGRSAGLGAALPRIIASASLTRALAWGWSLQWSVKRLFCIWPSTRRFSTIVPEVDIACLRNCSSIWSHYRISPPLIAARDIEGTKDRKDDRRRTENPNACGDMMHSN